LLPSNQLNGIGHAVYYDGDPMIVGGAAVDISIYQFKPSLQVGAAYSLGESKFGKSGTVICSRIGDPVDKPQMASVQVKLEEHAKLAELIGLVSQIVRRELSRIPLFCQELAHGRYATVNKILLLYKALANKSTLR
jgi:hypothetical protein